MQIEVRFSGVAFLLTRSKIDLAHRSYCSVSLLPQGLLTGVDGSKCQYGTSYLNEAGSVTREIKLKSREHLPYRKIGRVF